MEAFSALIRRRVGVKPLLDESDLEAHRQSTAARVQEGALQFLDDVLGVFPDGAPRPGFLQSSPSP